MTSQRQVLYLNVEGCDGSDIPVGSIVCVFGQLKSLESFAHYWKLTTNELLNIFPSSIGGQRQEAYGCDVHVIKRMNPAFDIALMERTFQLVNSKYPLVKASNEK
jgi:hypothetical protein